MIWKCIGASSIGSSHVESNKNCEDSIAYTVVSTPSEQILLCVISDGAGSAKYAQQASSIVTKESVVYLSEALLENKIVNSASIWALAEHLYAILEKQATEKSVNIYEFSCTYLGCVVYNDRAIVFQIGDGVIVREDDLGNYSCIFIPQNGEYSNTTNFLVDDMNFGNLKIKELDNAINEIALTTDGLQNLILLNESNEIHQPFFTGLFKWLRLAKADNEVKILEKKLDEYLNSEIINSKTDDDKTLFLATRINA